MSVKQEPESPLDLDSLIANKPGERNIFDALNKPSIPAAMDSSLKSQDLLSGLAVSDMDDFLSFTIEDSEDDTTCKKQVEKRKSTISETKEIPNITIQSQTRRDQSNIKATEGEAKSQEHIPETNQTPNATKTILNATEKHEIEGNAIQEDKPTLKEIEHHVKKDEAETKHTNEDDKAALEQPQTDCKPVHFEPKIENEKPTVLSSITDQIDSRDEKEHSTDIKTHNSDELVKDETHNEDLKLPEANRSMDIVDTNIVKTTDETIRSESSTVGDNDKGISYKTNSRILSTKSKVKSKDSVYSSPVKQPRLTRSKSTKEKRSNAQQHSKVKSDGTSKCSVSEPENTDVQTVPKKERK